VLGVVAGLQHDLFPDHASKFLLPAKGAFVVEELLDVGGPLAEFEKHGCEFRVAFLLVEGEGLVPGEGVHEGAEFIDEAAGAVFDEIGDEDHEVESLLEALLLHLDVAKFEGD
jgi:hypothetical protein